MPSSFGTHALLPDDLTAAITRAGYYPELVCDVVAEAVAGAQPLAHLVHQETTFDQKALRRHVTVLVATPARLVIAHADDHDGPNAEAVATASTETVPIASVRGVVLTHVVSGADTYAAGSANRTVTLTLGWGAVSRIDLLPATCGDPGCEADHGYDGEIAADDISLRISAAADGEQAVRDALGFARTLTRLIGEQRA